MPNVKCANFSHFHADYQLVVDMFQLSYIIASLLLDTNYGMTYWEINRPVVKFNVSIQWCFFRYEEQSKQIWHRCQATASANRHYNIHYFKAWSLGRFKNYNQKLFTSCFKISVFFLFLKQNIEQPKNLPWVFVNSNHHNMLWIKIKATCLHAQIRVKSTWKNAQSLVSNSWPCFIHVFLKKKKDKLKQDFIFPLSRS